MHLQRIVCLGKKLEGDTGCFGLAHWCSFALCAFIFQVFVHVDLPEFIQDLYIDKILASCI